MKKYFYKEGQVGKDLFVEFEYNVGFFNIYSFRSCFWGWVFFSVVFYQIWFYINGDTRGYSYVLFEF